MQAMICLAKNMPQLAAGMASDMVFGVFFCLYRIAQSYAMLVRHNIRS